MAVIKGEGMNRIFTGRLIKNAKYQTVGEKKYPKTELALAFGKEANEIITVALWYESATQAAGLKKNDRVLVGGVLSSREYEGKTYWTLDADFFTVQPHKTEDQLLAEMAAMPEVDPKDIPF